MAKVLISSLSWKPHNDTLGLKTVLRGNRSAELFYESAGNTSGIIDVLLEGQFLPGL